MNKTILQLIIFLVVLGLVFFGKSIFMAPKYSDGEVAPSFSTTLVDGQEFSLNDLKGNYVLLDFWGTWCGPCRVEMPKLKELHQTYHDGKFADAENFHIVSVALEKEGTLDRTKRAITKLGLDWDYHIFDPISNFKLLNAKIATELYGVREVPTKYFLGPDGNIIGVNMPFEDIKKILERS